MVKKQRPPPLAGENDFSVSPSDLGAAMVTIGRDAFNQNTLDNTLIDDLKIYKNAINADDVKEIFRVRHLSSRSPVDLHILLIHLYCIMMES